MLDTPILRRDDEMTPPEEHCKICREEIDDCTCEKLPEDTSGEELCETCKDKELCDVRAEEEFCIFHEQYIHCHEVVGKAEFISVEDWVLKMHEERLEKCL